MAAFLSFSHPLRTVLLLLLLIIIISHIIRISGDYCRQLGAHLYKVSLTSIHSSAEQDFIYNTWKKQYSTSRHSGLWVGLRSHNSGETSEINSSKLIQVDSVLGVCYTGRCLAFCK